MREDYLMIEVKELNIVFENCEEITIPKNVIGTLLIEKIHPVIQRIACNSISKYYVADEIVMEIFKEGDIKYKPFGCSEEESTLKRLSQYADITGIEIVYKNGEKENLLVDYDEGENEGTLGAPNINEDIYVSELENIYIVISKDKKVKDYFDKERINDEKIVNSYKDMLNIGIEEPEKVEISDENLPDLYRYVYLYFKDNRSSLAIRVKDNDSGWKWIYEDEKDENKGKLPISWKYPNSKIDKFIMRKHPEDRFNVERLKEKFS